MTKKKAPTRVKASKKSRVPIKTDISAVESETMKRVNRTLTSIENFLAKWDASAAKPDDMFPQIVKIRQFHDALLSWQKSALRGQSKDDEQSKVRRLRDFVLICRTYS